MSQSFLEMKQSDKEIDQFSKWFWRIVLVSFVFMVVGSFLLRREILFGFLWGPLGMYVGWNLLITVLIGIGIRLV